MSRRLSVLFLFLACGIGAGLAQVSEADQAAITEVVKFYLSKDSEQVKTALHPEVCCLMPFTPPQIGEPVVIRTGYSDKVFAASDSRQPEIQLETLDVYVVKQGVGAATLKTNLFVEELLLAKAGGKWQITNVVQKNNRTPLEGERETDAAVIESIARDYIEGAFSGDMERMKRALHYDFHKVMMREMPGSEMAMLRYSPYELMVQWAGAGVSNLPEDQWEIEYRLLNQYDNVAMAEVISSQYYDYVQLVRAGDHWKIVNVLWVPNPMAR